MNKQSIRDYLNKICINKVVMSLLFLLITYHLPLTPVVFGAFEENMPGARMRAMSGAFSAIADDPEAIFVQPAGSKLNLVPEVSFSYGRIFMNLTDESQISDYSMAFVLPYSRIFHFGVGYKRIGLDSFYNEDTILINTSAKLHKMVTIGINLKYLQLIYGEDDYTRIDPVFIEATSKTAFDFDFGFIIFPIENLNMAIVLNNLNSADIGILEVSKVQPSIKFGVAYTEESLRLSFETKQEKEKNKYSLGIEKSFLGEILSMRLGFGLGDKQYKKITTGFGTAIKSFSLDYALDYGLGGVENTGGTHYLTLSYKISKAREKKEKKQKKKAKKEKSDKIPKTFPVPARDREAIVPIGLYSIMKPLKSMTTQYFSIEESTSAAEAVEEIIEAPAIEEPAAEVQEELERETTAQQMITPADTESEQIDLYEQKIKKQIEIKQSAKPKVPKRPSKTHRVKAGDTLYSLAEKYYGKKAQWTAIYEANKDNIEKGVLKPGTKIIIP